MIFSCTNPRKKFAKQNPVTDPDDGTTVATLHLRRPIHATHLPLGELERALVPANLQQLHQALLVRRGPHHVADELFARERWGGSTQGEVSVTARGRNVAGGTRRHVAAPPRVTSRGYGVMSRRGAPAEAAEPDGFFSRE